MDVCSCSDMVLFDKICVVISSKDLEFMGFLVYVLW